jgi:hypothetical protein
MNGKVFRIGLLDNKQGVNRAFVSVRLLFIFTLAAVIIPTASLGAGECYRLIGQERYYDDVVTPDNKNPVCKVVLDNLNMFCNDETPMVCRFKIHPNYSRQLSVPKWETLDIHKNMDMIEATVRAPDEIYERRAHDKEYQDKRWQEYYISLRKGLDEGTATLHKAHFDLRNIGKSYDVLRVQHGKCTGRAIPADDPKKLATVQFERSKVDVEYTAEVLRIISPPTAYQGVHWVGDVFFYRGTTYAYGWIYHRLLIWKPMQEKNGEFNRKSVCFIEYIK